MESAERVMDNSNSNTAAANNKHLFALCMRGAWGEVVNSYKECKWAHTAIITKSGETALHVAVTDGQEEVVEQLVKALEKKKSVSVALRIQNQRRNTALHFAASMGTVRMIECIARADRSLVGVRNVDGETPLFLAALHGRKDAFMILHYISHMEQGALPISSQNCRRNDGDTILHCAINGAYFDLAFQIIHLYKDLVNAMNENGASPLHLLASKPSAFRSSSRLGRVATIIYYGIYVEELKFEANFQQYKTRVKKKCSYPGNYQTCVDLMKVMKRAAIVVTDKIPLIRNLTEKLVGRQNQTHTESGDPEALENTAANGVETGSEAKAWTNPLIPPNWLCCVDFLKFIYTVILVIFGKGASIIKKIKRRKEKHVWSEQIMNALLLKASTYEYDDDGMSKPSSSNVGDEETSPYSVNEEGTHTSYGIIEEQRPSTTKAEEAHQQNKDSYVGNRFLDRNNKHKKLAFKIVGLKRRPKLQVKKGVLHMWLRQMIMSFGYKKDKWPKKVKKMETPILIAAKNGVTEMVKKILELFPVAIHDMDANKKNIVLLAVENRQSHLYKFLCKRKVLQESLFKKVDNEGNSALHLAAKFGDSKSWLISGAALQMHYEIKWYSYVKQSMPPHFFCRYNKQNKTPKEIFTATHKNLVKSGGEWLKQTSESCSLVAALIATVAFATSSTIPGGVNQDSGIPIFENTAAFKVFAIASLIALCCSVTSVVLFLSILTSRFQEYDFGRSLPRKLIVGLTTLFVSIASMLVSFCAGHFLVLRHKLRYAALPIYAVTCLPITLFALAQFPLYFDLIWATFKKVPQRSHKATLETLGL